MTRIIEVIRQRPIMSSVMTRASPLMLNHCIVTLPQLSYLPSSQVIVSPHPPPVWGWGETCSVIIDLREKERDRQTNYVANQEFGRLAFVCLSFSLSRLSLSHYRSQTSTGHIDLLRIGLPGGSPQNNEHWPCQYL